jgi:hypothetical protein
MSGPFSPITSNGQPVWTTPSVPNGNFVPVTVLGLGTPEVGYGQDGYGVGGYDAPGTTVQAAAAPIWTTVVVR